MGIRQAADLSGRKRTNPCSTEEGNNSRKQGVYVRDQGKGSVMVGRNCPSRQHKMIDPSALTSAFRPKADIRNEIADVSF